MLRENRPLQGSKQGSTYPTMVGMLLGTYIKQRGHFLKDARISGYFDTKYMTVIRTGQISHNFEDQKFVNFLNLEQVNYRVTLVK